jgi:hypothetical protein
VGHHTYVLVELDNISQPGSSTLSCLGRTIIPVSANCRETQFLQVEIVNDNKKKKTKKGKAPSREHKKTTINLSSHKKGTGT